MKASETQAGRSVWPGAVMGICLAATGLLASSGDVMAAAAQPSGGSTGHAVVLAAIAWLITSMRVGRINGRWRIHFELSPIKGLTDARASAKSVKRGTVS